MSLVLIVDCASTASQAEVARFGAPTNQAMFERALRLHEPDISCATVNIAEGLALPKGVAIEDFDGVVFTGSPLHVYDLIPAVTRQIDFARAVFATSRPVWGSCWGLQLATVALGGSVRRNPEGRELGIARRIAVTEAGRSHPLFAGKSAVFDALCSHLDDVEVLPPGAEVLAENSMSAVQAMAVRTVAGGQFLGSQYHPEHDFSTSAALIQMRAETLVAEGLGRNETELGDLADDFRTLDSTPDRRDLVWCYGIDPHLLDPRRRSLEIGNWLRSAVQR